MIFPQIRHVQWKGLITWQQYKIVQISQDTQFCDAEIFLAIDKFGNFQVAKRKLKKIKWNFVDYMQTIVKEFWLTPVRIEC
jgi:hypothetical protein